MRRNGYIIAVFSAAVFLLIVAQQTKHSSQRQNPRHSLEADFPRITARYTALLDREGGDSIWVKRLPQPATGHQPPLEGEVLALHRTSTAIVSSFSNQAAKDGLILQVNRGPAGPSQTRTLMLFERQKPICGWQLREVARLYRVAIIIDDLGESMKTAGDVLRLPASVTVSVLPHLPASEQTAAEAHRTGREVMLHLPMQPLSGLGNRSANDVIRGGMSGLEVEQIITSDLDSVPFARGVNNHMGSGATADGRLMSEVVKALASRGLYFIDSRTTSASLAFRTARDAGLPAFYRSVFLDDAPSVEYTQGELRKLCAIVRQQGAAVAIGHPHRSTLIALKRFLPELDREDVELVPASKIVRLPEVATLRPPPGPPIANGD